MTTWCSAVATSPPQAFLSHHRAVVSPPRTRLASSGSSPSRRVRFHAIRSRASPEWEHGLTLWAASVRERTNVRAMACELSHEIGVLTSIASISGPLLGRPDPAPLSRRSVERTLPPAQQQLQQRRHRNIRPRRLPTPATRRTASKITAPRNAITISTKIDLLVVAVVTPR